MKEFNFFIAEEDLDEYSTIVIILKKMGFTTIVNDSKPNKDRSITVLTLPEDEEAHTLAKLKYGPMSTTDGIRETLLRCFNEGE